VRRFNHVARDNQSNLPHKQPPARYRIVGRHPVQEVNGRGLTSKTVLGRIRPKYPATNPAFRCPDYWFVKHQQVNFSCAINCASNSRALPAPRQGSNWRARLRFIK
jgi:hypothetical protein